MSTAIKEEGDVDANDDMESFADSEWTLDTTADGTIDANKLKEIKLKMAAMKVAQKNKRDVQNT
jgi:hypothetical protein